MPKSFAAAGRVIDADPMAVGAWLAAKAKGREGQMKFIGIDGLPGLDGGRIFFVGINSIRRRDMNPNIETKIHMVGIMVLLMLLVVVTFNDIKGIFFKKMG